MLIHWKKNAMLRFNKHLVMPHAVHWCTDTASNIPYYVHVAEEPFPVRHFCLLIEEKVEK